MKIVPQFAVALGAAGLALLMSAAAPALAHDSERMRLPYAPCGPTQDRYMERETHHHGMMDEDHHGMMGKSYGMGSGRGYGGMGGGSMMVPDERRGGMGYGMMMDPDEMMGPGRGGMGRVLRSDLTTDEVRHMMEHQLEWMGNPNLKLGKVEESGEGAIIAEVVTQDGSLVQRLEVDPHTGRTRQAQ